MIQPLASKRSTVSISLFKNKRVLCWTIAAFTANASVALAEGEDTFGAATNFPVPGGPTWWR
jgi:hypothetical protein